MLDFIMMTLSFFVALMLAYVVACVIGFALVSNEKFYEWYMGKVKKATEKALEKYFDEEETV